MRIQWEHLGVGRYENLPAFDSDGGKVACWENQEFAHWEPSESTVLRPPWSPLGTPGYWAAEVRRVLEFVDLGYPDAIVAFAWTGELVRVAVARTELPEGIQTVEAPDWYETGAVPRQAGMKIVGAAERLLLEGLPREVLWQVAGERHLVGTLVWPRKGVYGVAPGAPGAIALHPSVFSGKLLPREVGEPVEVTTRVVSIRRGLAVTPGPEGFELKTLIVANQDGTWSPAPVWVGEQFDLVKP